MSTHRSKENTLSLASIGLVYVDLVLVESSCAWGKNYVNRFWKT